jgi:hypothetical protein
MRWIREARGEGESTRPRAPPSQVDRGPSSTSPRSEPGRFVPELRGRFGGMLCEVVDVERPQRVAQLPIPRIA